MAPPRIEIACDRCGNCCPKNCPAFTIRNNAPTCLENPTLTGVPRQRLGCDMTTWNLYDAGFACRPVIDYLARIGQPDTRIQITVATGEVVLPNSLMARLLLPQDIDV